MKAKKTAILMIAAVLLMTAFAGAASADNGPFAEVRVTDIPGEGNYTSLEEAYNNVWTDGTIKLFMDVTLDSTFTIAKSVDIYGYGHSIKSVADDLSKNNLIKINAHRGKITLKDLTIDFNDKPGDLVIIDYSGKDTTRNPIELTNVKLTGMQTDSIFKTRSALHIDAADVTAVNLIIDQPKNPTLIDRWVSTIDLQATGDTHHNSTLTIDAMPYGAYCNGEPKADVYQKTQAGTTKVDPIEIELLFGQKLYVWPGFDEPVTPVTTWEGLKNAAKNAEFGDVIQLGGWFESEGTTKEITLQAGVLINPYGEDGSHHSFKLNDGYSIVVNDALGLASALGSPYAVAYGPGHIVAGKKFQNLPIIADYLSIPSGTTIQVDEFIVGQKMNKVTITIPADKTFVLTADKDGYVQVKENKHIVVKGAGSVRIGDDPREEEANTIETALPVYGILDLYAEIEQWPSNGVEGNGIVNIYNENSVIPAGIEKIRVTPFAEIVGYGEIIDGSTGEAIDVESVLHTVGSPWSISKNSVLTIDGIQYILEPVNGYGGYWDIEESAGTVTKAGMFKAVFVPNHGHSPSLSADYTPSSSVPVMVQETAQPTVTPTPAAPTAMPTSKPTTQQTQKSPAPLAGLIAGLGAAALLIKMRR